MLNKEIFCKEYFKKSDTNAKILQNNNFIVLLTNIYLNKVDQFMLERKEAYEEKNHFNKNCNRNVNKKTESSNLFINTLKETALENQKYNFTQVFRQHKVKTAKCMGLSKTAFSKKTFRRVYYNRYIHNFLLGIRGPKFLAIDTRDEISQFIKCNLQIELQLSEIYHSKSNKVRYLGFDIKVPHKTHNSKPITKSAIAYKKIKHKLRQKKSLIETRKNTFLNQILHKKITKIAN